MAFSMPTTQIVVDPGWILWAPLGTEEPTHTVAGSVFTDDWPAGWLLVGGTDGGGQFTYSINTDSVVIEEEFDPIAIRTTGRSGSFAFSMASWTLQNWGLALNGGVLSVVSGTGATQLGKVEPPDPGDEVRIMLGWQSLDNTARIVMRQALNSGDIQSAFKKAPDKALIPCEFQFEFPAGAKPFSMLSAGDSRYDGS